MNRTSGEPGLERQGYIFYWPSDNGNQMVSVVNDGPAKSDFIIRALLVE
jgi:hypothetical protein